MIEGNVSVTRKLDVPIAIFKSQMDIYMIHYKVWLEEACQWKSNMYLFSNTAHPLEEVLKTMSPWKTVRAGYDAIGMLKMVKKDVAHNQTEEKQTVMGFVESTAELFTYYQGENMINGNYSIMFKAPVKYIRST